MVREIQSRIGTYESDFPNALEAFLFGFSAHPSLLWINEQIITEQVASRRVSSLSKAVSIKRTMLTSCGGSTANN